MFTNLRSLTVAGVLLLASTAAAQSRSNYFFRSIGNSWLGGAVFTSASLSTASWLGGSSGDASLYLGADANVLRYTRSVAQLDLTAHNDVTGYRTPVQNAYATFRLRLAGYTVWDRSVRTTGDLGGISPRTYTLFPSDPMATVPVGPFTVTLRGNAGVTLGAGAWGILPTNTPEVRLVASGNTAAIARASVAIGVGGFNAGVELQGRFAECRLTANLIASAISGLSGYVNFQLQAISLRLVAFLEAFWTRVYSTTLTSWGSGYVNYNLISF